MRPTIGSAGETNHRLRLRPSTRPGKRTGAERGCLGDVEPASASAPSAVRLVARYPDPPALGKPHPLNSAQSGLADCSRRRLSDGASSLRARLTVCSARNWSASLCELFPGMQASAAHAEFAGDALPTHRPRGVCLTSLVLRTSGAELHAAPTGAIHGVALSTACQERFVKAPSCPSRVDRLGPCPAGMGRRYALTSVAGAP